MRLLVVPLGLLVLSSFVPGVASARCLDEPGDAAALVAGRAAVDAGCECGFAASHGQYVKCAAAVAKGLVASGALRPSCRRVLSRIDEKFIERHFARFHGGAIENQSWQERRSKRQSDIGCTPHEHPSKVLYAQYKIEF